MSKSKIYELLDEFGIDRKEFLTRLTNLEDLESVELKGMPELEEEKLSEFLQKHKNEELDKAIVQTQKVSQKKSSKTPKNFFNVLKSFLGKKAPKQTKTETLHVSTFSHPYQKKTMSPKTATWLLRCGFFFLVGLNVVSVGLILMRFKPTMHVVETSKLTQEKSQMNYRAKAFLDDYVKAYFNSPKKMSMDAYTKQMTPFYGKNLSYLSTDYQRGTSSFDSATLLSLNAGQAVYNVNYLNEKNQKNAIEMTIHYKSVGEGFVVSDVPFFNHVKDLKSTSKSIKQNALSTPDQLSDSENRTLDTFVKGLLKAYTTNQSLLDNISEGLSANDSETFKKLSYSYYVKQADGSYKAYISAWFESDLGTYPQNMSFTIQKNKSVYFAKGFQFTIPVGYDNQTTTNNTKGEK
ncbi:conjugal transfer protein [Lactococcus lactis]|uniref:conjugal transfer protein n=1 Tax=Lactococcus lactis TaxID=1358 RepID=UPI0023789D49|nr:conjugal transfer protein [Lactococcus lactis]WDA68707.1 conjugal transfer protein [Lactococcus lactis]